MHENAVADIILLQSCSTTMIDLSDSYVDCNDSLILVEANSVTCSEFAAETDTDSREMKTKHL